MSTTKTLDTHPPANAADTPAAGTRTAETIRNVLREKANSGASGRRGGNYGGDPKPPQPPPGTRRSMGKR